MICWKVDECVGYVSVHRGRMPLSEERPRWSEGFSCSNSSLLDSARGELPTTRIQVMRLFRKLSKGQLHTFSKGIEYPYIVCSIFGTPATRMYNTICPHLQIRVHKTVYI